MVAISVAIAGAVLALIIGFFIGRALVQRRVGEAKAAVARLAEREAGLNRDAATLAKKNQDLESQLRAAAEAATTAAVEKAHLQEREAGLLGQMGELQGRLAEQNKTLTTEFENIAGRILRASAADAVAASSDTLGNVIKPLQDRLQTFQDRIEKTYADESREVISLKAHIALALQTTQEVGTQADSLAQALRGDSQKRGRWGELVLERILEAAGLTEGREYVTQGRGLGLAGEEGNAQKPDVLVFLPENRCVVVDSKLSLLAYERVIGAADAQDREVQARLLVRDVKQHVDELAAAAYQHNEQLLAHDCVLMFVPIEGALATALNADPQLFLYGWQKKVVLAGPATLLMTLQTVARLWRYEAQNNNAREIARLAGQMCDKVSDSLSGLNDSRARIAGALEAHDKAVKRLADGKGNVLSLGSRIAQLGAVPKKPMPAVQTEAEALTTGEGESDEVVRLGGDEDQPAEPDPDGLSPA
ncbi:MAG: DNA recombination protein RmuC [Terriglobales bacterium]